MAKNKKKNKKNTKYNEFDSIVVSSTDCTGLIPALPETKEELENYNELLNMPNGILREE